MTWQPLIVLLALPLAASGLLAFAPARLSRGLALAVGCAQLAVIVGLGWWGFDPSIGGIQHSYSVEWIPTLHARFALGIDGLSLVLLLLNAIVHLVAVTATPTDVRAPRAFYSLLTLLAGAVNGVFLATDLFLFYVSWELVLVPMYFLIGYWGGAERRRAALRFLLFTLGGSLLLLVAILGVHLASGRGGLEPTLDLFALQSLALNDLGSFLGLSGQAWLFLLFFLGFAVKLPVVPLHTWLPAAHVQAPTPVSVVLAGVLLKLGAYGLLRIAVPLGGDAALAGAGLVAGLGVLNIVYGAWVALGQRDFKCLVAYSSISHMGFVLLGIAAAMRAASLDALGGATLQLFSHGLSAALMFLVVGAVQKRAGHRDLDRLGGLGARLPALTAVALVGFFTSLGLPGLAGFPAEALVLFGSWNAQPIATLGACFGLLLVAAFLLQAFRRVFTGSMPDGAPPMRDLSLGERSSMLPLVVLSLGLGLFPAVLLDRMWATLEVMLSTLPTEVLR